MLAQDTMTGALYEVPDSHYAGQFGEAPLDGLGLFNLGNMFKGLLGGGLPGLSNIVGGLLGQKGGGGGLPGIPGLSNLMNMFGGGGGGGGLPAIPGLPDLASLFRGGGGAPGLSGYGDSFAPGFGFPGLLSFPGLLGRLFGGGVPAPPRPAFPFPWLRSPSPPGWIPRPQPYTGMPPRRMYMRCSTWRGQPGMVPAWAAQAQAPLPGAVPLPGQLPPGVVPGVPGAGGGRHRRGRFRRRRR